MFLIVNFALIVFVSGVAWKLLIDGADGGL